MLPPKKTRVPCSTTSYIINLVAVHTDHTFCVYNFSVGRQMKDSKARDLETKCVDIVQIEAK